MTLPPDQVRIGGEFELDVAAFGRPAEQAPPKLPSAFTCWTDTGRSALLLAATDILRRGGRPVSWLPAFCCHSVSQTFRQAGFSVRYYNCSELHGDDGLPPAPQPGETILFVHFFGHRNQHRLSQVPGWKQTGVHVIEDAAQAALTQGIGTAGHYVIVSLRKFLAQPDGAMVGSEHELKVVLADADESFVSARTAAKLLRGVYAAPKTFLPLIAQTESHLDDSAIVPRHPSWLSRQLLSRTDLAAAAARRRDNCRSLQKSVTGVLASHLRTLFDGLQEGEVPLGLPVRVIGGLRDGLRDFLADRSVFCPVHWKLPHVPNATYTTADHRLASEIITLPIDQRMDQHHVRRFAMLLQQFFAGSP